jgi:hypothetical protein
MKYNKQKLTINKSILDKIFNYKEEDKMRVYCCDDGDTLGILYPIEEEDKKEEDKGNK